MNVLVVGQHIYNFGDDIAGLALLQRLISIKEITHVDVLYRFSGNSLPLTDPKITHITSCVPKYNIINHAGSLSDFIHLIKYSLLKDYRIDNLKKDENETVIEAIRKADLVIVAPLGASIGSYIDRTLLYTLLICISLDKKILFHLDTIDDSKKILFNYIASRILKDSFVFVREKRSVRYLEKCGIDSCFGIDTAFMFQNDQQYEEDNYNTLLLSDISSWHNLYKKYKWTVSDYIKCIVRPFADFSIADRKRICILKHADVDNAFMKEIVNYLHEHYADYLIDNSEINSPYLYDAIIKGSNFVVTCRYHGVILAEKYSIPFYALAYDSKTLEACNYAECDDQYDWIEKVMNDEQYFSFRVKNIYENYDEIVKNLKAFNNSDIKNTVYYPTEVIQNMQYEHENN